MSATDASRNTLESGLSSRSSHQSSAMQAALQVRRQYSRESKSKFRRACLQHLKASLSRGQETSA